MSQRSGLQNRRLKTVFLSAALLRWSAKPIEILRVRESRTNTHAHSNPIPEFPQTRSSAPGFAASDCQSYRSGPGATAEMSGSFQAACATFYTLQPEHRRHRSISSRRVPRRQSAANSVLPSFGIARRNPVIVPTTSRSDLKETQRRFPFPQELVQCLARIPQFDNCSPLPRNTESQHPRPHGLRQRR